MRIMSIAVLSMLLLFLVATPARVVGAQTEEAGAEIEKESYFRPGISPVHAFPGYDVTIVYFMDYQCPSCRQYTPDVARVLAEDRKVRIIYRDTPIISDMSTVAARAAIAASFQGRHAAFHHALMMSKGQMTEATIRAAADKAKVDWNRLQRDLKTRGKAIDDQIGRNVELAVEIGVLGTPAFIIGERQTNGALDYKGLKAELADARKAAGDSAPAALPAEVQANSTAAAAPALNDSAVSPSPEAKPIFKPSPPRQATPLDKARPAPASATQTRVLVLVTFLLLLAVIGGIWWWNRRRQVRLSGHADR